MAHHKIECCIDEWATGLKEDIKFIAAAYKDVFKAHLNCLDAYEKATAEHNMLPRLQKQLHADVRYVTLGLY